MKELYEIPEVEIVEFSAADVITTSDDFGSCSNDDSGDWSDPF